MISDRVKKMEVSGVRKMFEMASKMKNPIDLSIGLPDFDVPEEIKEMAIEAIRKGFNKYTPTTGIPELKDKIIEKLEKDNNIKTNRENVIVTSAASGALSIILTTIINPEDEIIIFDPYFVSYKQLIIQNGGIPVYAKTKEDFSLDLYDLRNKITSKTKAIIINSPNNPTGKVYDKSQILDLIEIAKKYDILIISDEVYEKFSYEKNNFSPGSVYEKTVTINGFSKSHAMTGWRIGYCTGPKEIIDEAVKIQQFNFVCAPTPFQHAAAESINYNINKFIQEYRKKRDIVYEGLKQNYSIVKPDGAFYAFIKYPYEPEKFIENCISNNLLVVPGSTFSEKNEYFRISFAADNKILEKAVEILKKMVVG